MSLKQLCFTLLLMKTGFAFCQDKNQVVQKNPKRFEYYFNGGFGLYFPTQKSAVLENNGPIYSFQVQINYKQNYFTRIAFDQYNVGYNDDIEINGLKIKINDKVQILNSGIDYGYTFHLFKKFAPFAYVGVGYASMEVPKISYDISAKTIDITNTRNPFLSLRGGVGGEYEFSKFFIVFAEFQYLSIPFKTDISNKELNGISFQIGFKTPLQ
jgi:opacity protein-like surface antigen